MEINFNPRINIRREPSSWYICSRRIWNVALVLGLALIAQIPEFALAAQVERRVALVIGNGAYINAPALVNPSNDARDMAAALGRLGFEVVPVINGDHRAMLEGLSQFGRAAEGVDVALLFYAGHGLQVAGHNYLLPVTANILRATDLPAQAVKAGDIIDIMEASDARVKLIFLDACRNNPLSRSLSRSAGRGLAKIDSSSVGTMIAFATAPGDVAADGEGRNSPFTRAMLDRIATPGLEIRSLMGRVREAVYAATNNHQVPWVNEALIGEFYFGGRVPSVTSAPVSATSASDAKLAALQQQFDKVQRMLEAQQALKVPRKALPQPTSSIPSAPTYSAPSPATTPLGTDFLFPDSERRSLTRGELIGLSRWELKIARNEIFARRGRYFKTAELQDYFSRFNWYHPRTWNPPLNPIESANIALIKSVEDTK